MSNKVNNIDYKNLDILKNIYLRLVSLYRVEFQDLMQVNNAMNKAIKIARFLALILIVQP